MNLSTDLADIIGSNKKLSNMSEHLAGTPKPFVYNPPKNPHITVLYEDEHLLALSKPSGLLTVPGKPAEHADCLESRVREKYPTARTVHRLDMDTSGVIIMALNKPSLANLSMQFEKRRTKKVYVARIHGKLEPECGTIDLPLICDWPNRPKQIVDHERGRQAITNWEVIAHENNATRVKLAPLTGRSHQLRVHMATLGHPILGDNLYAHDEAFQAAERLQLHAERLVVKHPTTEELLEFYDECGF